MHQMFGPYDYYLSMKVEIPDIHDDFKNLNSIYILWDLCIILILKCIYELFKKTIGIDFAYRQYFHSIEM